MKRNEAFRAATQVVVAAIHVDHLTPNGMLPWPKNHPKNQRLDLLRGYINVMTDQFMEDDNG